MVTFEGKTWQSQDCFAGFAKQDLYPFYAISNLSRFVAEYYGAEVVATRGRKMAARRLSSKSVEWLFKTGQRRYLRYNCIYIYIKTHGAGCTVLIRCFLTVVLEMDSRCDARNREIN